MTLVALVPATGAMELMVGGPRKVKTDLVAASPTRVETVMGPLEPEPTTAVIRLADMISCETAGVPPKNTCSVPCKLVPLMVTVEPAPAALGVNERTTGGL